MSRPGRDVPHRRLRALVAAAAVAGAAAAGLAGCGSGSDTITAHATFPDVGALAANAPVELADVTVGHVGAMRLTQHGAQVDLRIQRGAHVPADVQANLTQTSLIGETIVSLVPTPGGPGGLLADGTTITRTQVVPNLEDLVKTGTEFIGSLSAGGLANMLQQGAAALGGEGPGLHQLIDNLATVVGAYAQRAGVFNELISRVNTLTAQLAPSAQANAQALTNLAQTTTVLNDQSNRLLNLLHALTNMSQQGGDILATYLPQINTSLSALQVTASQLAQHQAQLADVFTQLPKFLQAAPNLFAATQGVARIQVVADTILCGVPPSMGGSSPTDPVTTCNGFK